MENLTIAPTTSTPRVDFDFEAGTLCLSGESHPEDVTEFYGPVMTAFGDWIDGLGTGACRFDFDFVYFNSSTAKIVMMLMDKLDEAAEGGAAVTIRWLYDPEDDNMLELGEEFGEDVTTATLELVATEP